jgi:hypothetical protein
MKQIILIALIGLALLFSGCIQPNQFNEIKSNTNSSIKDFTNPYDLDDVCPFECCKNEEKYYDKPCTGKLLCTNNKCIEKQKQEESEPEKITLKDNEVYPGIFIEILDYKEFTQVIKEPEEVYGLVGQYILDTKRDGMVYGYENGKKLIIVEMTVENKSLNDEYRRETFNTGYSLQFYLPKQTGDNYMETHAPPENHDTLVEYYSDVPPFNKGDKKEVFVSFLVPVEYTATKLLMIQEDEYIPVNRTIEFPLTKAG